MSEYGFHSGLSTYLNDFVAFKRSTGQPYVSGLAYLKDFDRYFAEHSTGSTNLDQEICLTWAQKRPSENNNGYVSRISPLRQFGKYLNNIGIEAFVLPDSFHGKVAVYIPHIFTEEELKQFFSATDSLAYYYQSVARHLVAPVLFRLLYCCGLRPFEVRLLEKADLNLVTGRVLIKKSKGHKERLVMIPKDLLHICRIYAQRVTCFFPDSKFFFPNHQGGAYSASQLRYLFELCWSKAGIAKYDPPKPRVYDFRHTYTTYRLYRWMQEGRDLSAWLPYLSAFLGHASLSSTAYYIHLVPGAFQRMSGIDLSKFEDLIPEVSHEL